MKKIKTVIILIVIINCLCGCVNINIGEEAIREGDKVITDKIKDEIIDNPKVKDKVEEVVGDGAEVIKDVTTDVLGDNPTNILKEIGEEMEGPLKDAAIDALDGETN